MDHLSSRIISIAKNAFDCDQCEDCDFDKNNKILPIVSMINKKDYDSLNGHCDSIRNDEDIKHGLFLTTCAITDDIQMINYIVKCFEIDVHKKNNYGNNGAMIACLENKNLNVIKHLFEYHKIDHNAVNIDGDNCLIFACSANENLEIIKYLVGEKSISLYWKNNNGNNCLVACYGNENLEIIKYLVEEKSMSLDSRDNNGKNCLLIACSINKNLEIIKYLIEDQKISIYSQDNNGYNCLHCACRDNENLEIIKYLIEDQKMSIASHNDDGYMCLHCACRYNENLEIIKYLIFDKELSVNHRVVGIINYTCFDLACHNKNPLIAPYILLQKSMEYEEVEITLEGVDYEKYVQIVQLIQNDHKQLYRLLMCGSKKYSTKKMKKIINVINPLKLQKVILDLYEIDDPYNKKYSEFVIIVDDLFESFDKSDNKYDVGCIDKFGNGYDNFSLSIADKISLEQSCVSNVKIARITKYTLNKTKQPFNINYTKHDLLFKHNNVCYYGDQNIINDSILCLKDIGDTYSFDQPVELEGSLPEYVINLYIQSIYALSFDIDKINPVDIYDFLKFVDQYPTSSLSIDLLEGDIVKYFNEKKINYNDTMKEICDRYGLKLMYMDMHINLYGQKLMYMDMHNNKLLKKQENDYGRQIIIC